MERPVLEVADIFSRHGAAWREQQRGHLSLGQLKVMTAIEQIRGPDLESTVEDDGIGFDVEQYLAPDSHAESFGLAFMRERARQIDGRLEIGRGSSERGVRVSLMVSLGR